MAHFRSLASPKRWTDAFSASQSALESRGQSSRLSLAIVDGPVHPPRRRETSRDSRSEWIQDFLSWVAASHVRVVAGHSLAEGSVRPLRPENTGGTITGVSRYIKKTKKKAITSVAVEPAKSPILTQFRGGQTSSHLCEDCVAG